MVYIAHRFASSRTAPPALPRKARAQAAALLALLVPAATLFSFALAEASGSPVSGRAAVLTLLVCVAGGALALRGLTPAYYPHTRLGLCNVITLTRAAGIAVLAGLVVTPTALTSPTVLEWGLVILAGAVLTLDLVDGWAARRSGLRSDFGARFDVETDVAFAVVLALLAWQADKVGVWFLALGALRPAFLLARALWPWLGASLPDAMWRKTVAATQMIAQVALLAPVITPPFSTLLGAAVLGGVVASFIYDITGLYRRRPQPGADAEAKARV